MDAISARRLARSTQLLHDHSFHDHILEISLDYARSMHIRCILWRGALRQVCRGRGGADGGVASDESRQSRAGCRCSAPS